MTSVLLVDDDPSVRRQIRVIVDWESLGIGTVFEAGNGLEALGLMDKAFIHLAVIDIRMPQMNGIELMRAVREKGWNTLIIILSGAVDFQYARDAIAYRAFDYLLKPVNEEELQRTLHEAVALVRSRQGAEYAFMMQFKRDVGGSAKRMTQNEEHSCLAVNDRRILHPVVVQVVRHIVSHVNGDLSLERLAGLAYVHPNYLSGLFKQETGENLVDFIARIRVEKAKTLLFDRKMKLHELADHFGYKDARYFGHLFKKYAGCSPFEYRKRMGNNDRASFDE